MLKERVDLSRCSRWSNSEKEQGAESRHPPSKTASPLLHALVNVGKQTRLRHHAKKVVVRQVADLPIIPWFKRKNTCQRREYWNKRGRIHDWRPPVGGVARSRRSERKNFRF